ncbi:MAG: tRNA pseudouridine(55) synthase TruB [Chloroflexota bacterium]|nr:tRNA pseudouridine(55) synthase TruB [Chloroflexota bacterium]
MNIDKPAGLTSMDVVRRIRKASNIKRVGHGGTLDPFATGVLPIAIGSATRLLEYMLNGDKACDAEIELGRSTDSYDKSGVLTDTGDTSGITHKDLIKTLKEFEGDILQIPPMFSAIKSKGKKLYELARQGIEIERKARQVSVNCLELIDFKNPFVRIRILCGKGFYVRSLANDLGNYLGCGGTLIKLRREYSSGFLLEESHELVEVEKAYSEGNWEKVTKEPGNCLPNASHIDLTTEELAYVSNGREITAEGKNDPSVTGTPLSLAYDANKKLVAVLRLTQDNAGWHPEKVFHS